jgi:hypothetical protein
MDTRERITPVTLKDQFSACPRCGYQKGFHVSFSRIAFGHPHVKVIPLCPECGERYDLGWIFDIR